MGCERSGGASQGSNCRKAGCVCEVVRFIKRLQDAAGGRNDCRECETDCFLTPLGSLVNPTRNNFNTRVFSLLTEDGDFFKALFRNERRRQGGDGGGSRGFGDADNAEAQGRPRGRSCVSVFFRVQNVFDSCCATLQVLEPRNRRGPVDITTNGKIDFDKLCDVTDFRPTDACVTVDLSCFCGIQCFDDIFIRLCDED